MAFAAMAFKDEALFSELRVTVYKLESSMDASKSCDMP
jgi:hypothetical protein